MNGFYIERLGPRHLIRQVMPQKLRYNYIRTPPYKSDLAPVDTGSRVQFHTGTYDTSTSAKIYSKVDK